MKTLAEMQQLAPEMTWDQIRPMGGEAGWNDSEGFSALIQRQSAFVFRVAFAVLRNTQDAEDVTQETFLKLHRKGSWRQIQDERAFLARVAWRLAQSKRGERKNDSLISDLTSPAPTPEDFAAESDWSGRIHVLISALPEELRNPLLLSLTEELKSHEIAHVLGIPEGTVRNRLFRARQILKQKLKLLMEPRHER